MIGALKLREIGLPHDLFGPLARGTLRPLLIQDIKANPRGWADYLGMCLKRCNPAAAHSPNLQPVRDAPFAIVLLIDGGKGSSGEGDPPGTAAGKPVYWLRLRRNDLTAAEWAAIGVDSIALDFPVDDFSNSAGCLCTWDDVDVRI